MAEKPFQEIPRAWREQYEKGKAAFERNNLDYAISILSKVLEQEPGFYECREALRASQFKKAGAASGGFFKKILGSTNPKLVQAQVSMRSKPLDAISVAEQVLNGDPHNLTAHKVLAEAALAADLPRTAVLSLEIVHKHSPRDRGVALQLAEALSRAGQPGRAEGILAELARAYPGDQEISQALKNVSARRTMVEGGYESLAGGEGSYRDILRDEKEAVRLEQEKREHKTEDVAERLIAEYQERLQKEPGNLRLIRAIAELYADKKDFDKARAHYQRLVSADTPDPSVEKALADLEVKRLDYELSQLDPAAPDVAEQTQRIKQEKQAFLLADCKRRVDHYPNDLQLRFELGLLYFEAGRITEAIQELQKAQNNPHRRIQALFHLGLCFMQRGVLDLAARTFQNAIKEKVVFDEEKKELIYVLGCTLEKMGKKEEALEQFKLIYEVDIGYRDVAAKVDAFYSSQG
jgi:tetratricopeptide (TPR) repeat protein